MAFSEIRIPLRFPSAAPNLEPREDIWPTETAPVFRRREDGIELVQLRWGFPPGRPKGAPVINFRSEGRRLPVGRCLVPASHFFEFTGAKAPKSKWKFTKSGEDWFCFAGLRSGRTENHHGETFIADLRVKVAATWHRYRPPKTFVRRITAQRAYLYEPGAFGIRPEPTAAIVRRCGGQTRRAPTL